jgi:hypothetical protein
MVAFELTSSYRGLERKSDWIGSVKSMGIPFNEMMGSEEGIAFNHMGEPRTCRLASYTANTLQLG